VLKQLGENTAQEFFETLIYFVAYEEASKIIRELTKDIENDVIREAVESALNVLAFGLIFELIRMEEAFIERIFNTAEALVVAILGWGQNLKRKLLKGKGVKAILRGLLGGFLDNSGTVAQVVVSQAGNQMLARQSIYNSAGHQGLFGTYLETKRYLIEREDHHFKVAEAYTNRYLQTLLFKLFTANFTEKDRTLLRKILNKPNVSPEDLNKLSEFMFVKDDKGNIVGLSKAFLELLNGLGYLHNKA